MLRKLVKRYKQKQKDAIFSDYPCADYLHNALRFIQNGKPDVAYTEICHALLRSGDKLSSEEEATFKQIQEKYRIK